MKNIILVLILCCMIISCGKKGDPKYQDSQKKVSMQTNSIKQI